MKHIDKFCHDADRISISTDNIPSILNNEVDINLEHDEIRRTRYNIDGSCLFTMRMNILKHGTINDEIKFMKTIELVYPKAFNWRYDGWHIECIAKIPMKKEYMGILGRYKGAYGFIKMLRDRLLEILQYRGDKVITSQMISTMIVATGSINSQTNMWAVDIKPNDKPETITANSAGRKIRNSDIKELDMKYWVKEINPDFLKPGEPPIQKRNKYAITDNIMKQYPICIHKIGGMKQKGNYARFLLGSFLLGVHNERDAKHQIDLMLNDTERKHMNEGNCKGQWRALIAKQYAIPSCKTMMEHGFCPKQCKKFGMLWNLDSENLGTNIHTEVKNDTKL